MAFCFSSNAGLPGADERRGWGVFRFAVHFRELACFLSCKRGFVSLDVEGGWGARATVRTQGREQAAHLPLVLQAAW